MNKIRLRLFALFLINALGIIIYLFNLVITPFELTFGTFTSGIYWFVILLIPSIIPVLFQNKIWRYTTFIFGVLITLINLFIGVGYVLDDQFKIGMILMLYWGIFGILGSIISLKWIKQ
ncbi:hypothetical protein QUH73_20690 [Labilibaculum sp. K2S]|uniref:hypothetical protein n=1 Tax=Labilibaculum sp. K2S TaxID=3056386 RepID=UPI0025A3E798|nr:hypothetical protein [Labilibaculum sp. K2S]MDM8162243.1 hypothetical protein [Labilibaculum sp. K2S]